MPVYPGALRLARNPDTMGSATGRLRGGNVKRLQCGLNADRRARRQGTWAPVRSLGHPLQPTIFSVRPRLAVPDACDHLVRTAVFSIRNGADILLCCADGCFFARESGTRSSCTFDRRRCSQYTVERYTGRNAACGVRDAKRSPPRVVLSLKVRLSLQVCRCEFSAAFHSGQTNG
jgi:hypothetical protein